MTIQRRPVTARIVEEQPSSFLVLTSTKLNAETVQTVDARQLWKFLESKQQFGNWIRTRIEDGRFVENKDFIVNKKNKVKNQQVTTDVGDPIDYHISMDMAKHLITPVCISSGTSISSSF